MRWYWIIGLWPLGVFSQDNCDLFPDCKANKFVNEAEKDLEAEAQKVEFDSWAYQTNITDDTNKKIVESETAFDQMAAKYGKIAKSYDLSKLTNQNVKRKLKLLSNIGKGTLPDDKLKKLNELISKMGKTYSTAKVLDYETKKKKYSLNRDLSQIFSASRNPEELKYYWEQWRASSGKPIRDMFSTYIELYNEAAKINGFKDASIMKIVPYESDSFKNEVEETWLGLKPLYEQLHAYVRKKLNKVYGDKVVKNSGAIPAHLLGNMWAQSWGNKADELRPFPKKPSIDVTEEMKRKGWTYLTMFQKAEDFFQSMGLDKMPETFWSDSLLVNPNDGRELNCHGSAWDFQNGKDFRIKMCTSVNQEDFVTVNHEMGHIQYFLQYKNLSFLYRDGANPGFHEGVADILSLAVGTATYFQRLGLLGKNVDTADHGTDINILFDMALHRVAFLPFGYLIDKFRWDVFSGKTSVENMNCHWWKLRYEIQGVMPPSKRSYKDFDPGAKYHVANDVGYIRYFTAFMYEFQFYRVLCLISGKYIPGDPAKPLHRCNFFGSREAGDKLKEMLKMGASKPWSFAMEKMTGQRLMNSEAIRVYFQPLEDWLKTENENNGVDVGWGSVNVDEICEQYEKTQNGNSKMMINFNTMFFIMVTYKSLV